MWYVRPAKAQISLRIRQSDLSLCSSLDYSMSVKQGAQWLSGRVLDLRPRGCGFEPHRLS